MPIETVYELLASNLPDREHRPALIAGDRELTYGELMREVEAMSAQLAARAVRQGDRVGIYLPKSIDETVATFAIARLGAVFVDLHYQWTLAQAQHIVDDCGIEVVLTNARRSAEIGRHELASRLRHVVIAGAPCEAAPPAPIAAPAPNDLAALLYTSGSTGHPKGVMFTHRNIVDGARIVSGYLRLSEAERILSVLPFSFDYGLNQLMGAMYVGAAVVLQPVSMPAEIARAAAHRITGLAAVPTIWIQLVRFLEDTGATLPLRYVTNSGGGIPKGVLKRMPKVFPGTDIYLMYGLTEAFRSTYLPPELFAAKMGAIGIPLAGVDIYVVDPEKGICGPGERGEILHRGALISQGYWGNPEATAEKFKVCEALRPQLGDERVLYSGDIGYRDEDGILWFVERAGSMIKSSGFRISPTEVEQIVCRSGRTDLAVAFGVPDPLLGEAVHVAVPGPRDDAEAIAAYCKQHMPGYMTPHRIHCWDGDLPRTSSGKVCRQTVIRSLL